MERWKLMLREPSLDELLADDMMGAVTSSAGTDRRRLRALMDEMARRLSEERLAALRPRCVPPEACWCPPSAA
ncbi:MAG TPA: hypothetical protein VN668_20125 [Stellaceae bacterium]|nr:hypothetical protein [Stellaceae bacterium]